MLVAALFAFAATAHAQEASDPAPAADVAAPAPPSDFSGVYEQIRKGEYEAALASLDAVLAANPLPVDAAQAHAISGYSMIALGRAGEALGAFDRSMRADALQPFALRNAIGAAIRFDTPEPALLVIAETAKDNPDLLRGLDRDLYTRLIAKVRGLRGQAAVNDALIPFAAVGYGDGDFVFRDRVRQGALLALLGLGRPDDARKLASTITSRRTLVEMLTERRYESLWPLLATRVGPGMASTSAEAVSESLALLRASPADPNTLKSAVTALYRAGRLEDAAARAARFAGTPEAARSVNADGAQLIDEHAEILDTLGRTDDADARLASITARGAAGKAWLVAPMVHRAEMLVRRERWAAALVQVTRLKQLLGERGSPFAKQLVRRLEICTLHGLARDEDAAALLPALIEAAADARVQTIGALICLDHDDEAEAVARAALADGDETTEIIAAFQPAQADWAYASPTERARLARLLERPAVRAAFDQVGRILPDGFWIKVRAPVSR